MTIEQFVERFNVRASVDYAGANPNMENDDWARSANHYRVVLRVGRRSMTTYYSMGSAHTNEPGAADVLDSLASDAAGVQYARDFNDWAADYGYDTDSRRAHRTYQTIVRQGARLQRLLGLDAYQALLNDVERL